VLFWFQVNWPLLDGYIASVERHKPEIELVEVAAIRAAHDPELVMHQTSLSIVARKSYSILDILVFLRSN
jgi:hypothetical protein